MLEWGFTLSATSSRWNPTMGDSGAMRLDDQGALTKHRPYGHVEVTGRIMDILILRRLPRLSLRHSSARCWMRAALNPRLLTVYLYMLSCDVLTFPPRCAPSPSSSFGAYFSGRRLPLQFNPTTHTQQPGSRCTTIFPRRRSPPSSVCFFIHSHASPRRRCGGRLSTRSVISRIRA